MTQQQPTPVDVQSMIITAFACQALLTQDPPEIVMTHEQLKELIEKFTLRLEIVNPRQPETSNVKISVISVDDAKRLMQSLQKKRQ